MMTDSSYLYDIIKWSAAGLTGVVAWIVRTLHLELKETRRKVDFIESHYMTRTDVGNAIERLERKLDSNQTNVQDRLDKMLEAILKK
jgi:hypothetical protein